jgi:hypothetical protein
MNFRKVAPILVIASLVSPAVAQERVVVGTQRLTDNAALFLAAAAGYFKAEGIDLAMTLMRTIAWWPKRSRPAPQILRSPGSRRWPSTAPAKAQIKAIAARTREKCYYEGTELVVSNIGFRKGLQKFEDLSGKTVAIDALGSISRYQLEQIARVKKVDINRVTVKPMQTLDAIARAIGTNEVDAAIMPALHARELLASNQAKLVGWYSELDEIQFGALFASSARRSRNSYGLTGVLVAQGSKFKAYRRHQVARGGDNHRPVRVSRSWNKRRGRSRGQRLFHRPAGTTRCRRHRPSDRLAQGARPDRQDRQRARYGRSEFRQVRIFPQRRISLLPASPCPETIM